MKLKVVKNKIINILTKDVQSSKLSKCELYYRISPSCF